MNDQMSIVSVAAEAFNEEDFDLRRVIPQLILDLKALLDWAGSLSFKDEASQYTQTHVLLGPLNNSAEDLNEVASKLKGLLGKQYESAIEKANSDLEKISSSIVREWANLRDLTDAYHKCYNHDSEGGDPSACDKCGDIL